MSAYLDDLIKSSNINSMQVIQIAVLHYFSGEGQVIQKSPFSLENSDFLSTVMFLKQKTWFLKQKTTYF